MLLFNNAKLEKDKVYATIIISSRTEVINNVRNQLEIRNVENIHSYQVSINDFNTAEIVSHVKFLIFDVEELNGCEEFMSRVELLLSKETVCIAVGNSDSILLAENYRERGIHYFFNHADQYAKLGQAISHPSLSRQESKSSLKICVLGCKGGVGNSTLCFHLASQLVQMRSVSLLLVQGAGGSKNLDLIAKKDLSNEATKLSENLYALFEQDEHKWNFHTPVYNDYDFTLFDHTLYNAGSTETEHVLSLSNCVVAVFNHDLSSIRNAKKLIEHHKHLNSGMKSVNKIILCFNENQRPVSGTINKDEASNLIGLPIDIHIPFMKSSGDPASPLTFQGKNKILLEQLTNLTLGRKNNDAKPAATGLFFGLKIRKSQ